MRYLGEGIGHQNQDARWTSSNRYEDDNNDMEVDLPCEEDFDDDQKKLQGLQELAKELATRAAGEDDEDIDIDNDSDGSSDEDEVSDDDEASDDDDLFPDGEEDEDSDLGPCDGEDEDENDADDFGSF